MGLAAQRLVAVRETRESLNNDQVLARPFHVFPVGLHALGHQLQTKPLVLKILAVLKGQVQELPHFPGHALFHIQSLLDREPSNTQRLFVGGEGTCVVAEQVPRELVQQQA